MQYLRQTLRCRVGYTPSMKIERHGQAENTYPRGNRIVIQRRIPEPIGIAPSSEFASTPACRIAEACSLMVKDIYTNTGTVRSTINFRKANTKGKLANPNDSGNRRFAKSPDILETQRGSDLFIPRSPPFAPLEASAHQLSGSDFERSVRIRQALREPPPTVLGERP